MTQLDLIPDPEREALAARIRRAIPEQVRKANAREQARRCAEAARLAKETTAAESLALQERYLTNGRRL